MADRTITVVDGRIAAVEEGAGNGSLVLPALANAHDHARVVRLSQVGSFDVPLEAWLPYLALVPAVDPWLASAVAFGRIARGGVGSTMAHYTRVQGLTDFPTEARAVAKAARDVGVHVGFAVHCRDMNPLVYDPHQALAHAAIARGLRLHHATVSAAAAACHRAGGDGRGGGGRHRRARRHGSIRAAGVQWCTDDMLRRIGEASAATGRRVHMHLLETRYQRNWADRTYPQGIVRYLDEIGLVNERVSFAHCIWMRPDEMDLVAAGGATIVVNTSSNFIVSSGVAPVGEMLRRGCRVAMGLDGLSFDEDEDALREMRLALCCP